MNKDSSISNFISSLELDRRQWEVMDHWQADLFAVGVKTLLDDSRLVYVCTFGKHAGTFDYQCERIVNGEAETTQSGTDISHSELISEMEQYLGPDNVNDASSREAD